MVDSDNFNVEDLKNYDGVVIPGGFGYRGIEGKISAIQYKRRGTFSGYLSWASMRSYRICQKCLWDRDANSSEFSKNTSNYVIDLLPNQNLEKDDVGASMRLGTYPCKIKKVRLLLKSTRKK